MVYSKHVPESATLSIIESLSFEGLRGIHAATIDGLASITFLVGKNGSGKSTVLEAAGVIAAGSDPAAAFRAVAQREWLGLGGMDYWFGPKGATVKARVGGAERRSSIGLCPLEARLEQLALQRRADARLQAVYLRAIPSQVIVDEDGELLAWHDGSPDRRYSLLCARPDRPVAARSRFAGHFSSSLRRALAAVKLTPWYPSLMAYLQTIRPRNDTIESIAVGDRDEPFVFERDPRTGYPLAYAGDGFRRLLEIAATLAEAKGGIAAIDEPEAFAHPGLFRPLAGLFRHASDEGTQLLIATHSIELVRDALDAMEDIVDRCAVIGLRNDAGTITATTSRGRDAYRRVVELGDDLRT